MEKKKIEEIKTHPTFESLFPINPAVLEKIEQDMRDGRYDVSQPIILATWEGQEEPVCIDGHTRRQAAINVGIEEVPVWIHEFDTEEEAQEKAIKLQRNRRNMTDAEIVTCVEALDKKRPRGGDRRSEAVQSKRQDCPIENGGCSSAQETGDLLGISERKVRQARTVMEHADESTKEAVKQGDLSINQAYQRTQKKRRRTEPDAESKNTAEQGPPDQGPEVAAETKEPKSPENHFPQTLGRSVHVFLPDWQFNALIRQGNYIESHVRKAVDLYVESLGVHPPKDDDEEYLDLDEYGDE
jgi:hypothetical protein